MLPRGGWWRQATPWSRAPSGGRKCVAAAASGRLDDGESCTTDCGARKLHFSVPIPRRGWRRAGHASGTSRASGGDEARSTRRFAELEAPGLSQGPPRGASFPGGMVESKRGISQGGETGGPTSGLRRPAGLALACRVLPLADTAKQKGPAAVTKLLIAANVAVFGWQVWLSWHGGGRALAGFVGEHALVARRIVEHPLAGEQWRTVFTHMFLHGGALHLLGNVWFLWIFGGNVEDRLGSLRFLAFYVATGMAAGAAQIAAGPS
ncbi:MAG: rhomboid family intramembrane serine protease, partial [Verrucomicrobia bacterium]|nr:rhomboid family intramembrane serine protease [Verrucomicrobiota bacterium]